MRRHGLLPEILQQKQDSQHLLKLLVSCDRQLLGMEQTVIEQRQTTAEGRIQQFEIVIHQGCQLTKASHYGDEPTQDQKKKKPALAGLRTSLLVSKFCVRKEHHLISKSYRLDARTVCHGGLVPLMLVSTPLVQKCNPKSARRLRQSFTIE